MRNNWAEVQLAARESREHKAGIMAAVSRLPFVVGGCKYRANDPRLSTGDSFRVYTAGNGGGVNGGGLPGATTADGRDAGYNATLKGRYRAAKK